MRYFVVFALCAVSVIAAPFDFAAITDTPKPSPAYNLGQMDVVDYDIEFVVNPDDTMFEWSATIRFVNLAAGDTTYYFDLVGMDFPSCTAYLWNDSTASWESVSARYDDTLFAVDVGPCAIGETLLVEIPGTRTHFGTGFYKETGGGEYWIYTLFWPSLARYAFPCIDHPADRATCTMTVVAPESLTVAGGGVLIDSVESGAGLIEWTFRYDQPVCTYNISFAAGPYATIIDTALDSLRVKSFAYPSRLTQTEYDFGRIPEIIALWDSLFGDYPFDAVGCVVVPMDVWGGAGGMEHQMLPQIGDYLITGTRAYEKVVAHELLHQWFGDCVGIGRWEDFWLNEGIAVYSEVLWTEHTEGTLAARNYMSNEENQYRNWAAVNGDFPMFAPVSFLSPIPYSKGACWWNTLRWMLGDDDFFAFLRYYFDRFRFETVVTDSLRLALDDFTTDDWMWYFDEWVFGQGYPEYLYDRYVRHDSTGWWIDVNLRQVQDSPSCTLFTNPVPLEIFTPDSTIATTITPTSRDYWQRIALDDTIDYIIFDRLNVVCGDFSFSPTGIGEPQSRPDKFSISAYPNPFNSTVTISLSAGVGASNARSGQVGLKIFDISGRLVADLPVTNCGSPQFVPTPVIWQPEKSLGSGVYLIRAKIGNRKITKRIVYLR